MTASNLVWSPEAFELKSLVDRRRLPAIVRTRTSHHGSNGIDEISAGQIFRVDSRLVNEDRVMVRDSQGRIYSFPQSLPVKFQLLPSRSKFFSWNRQKRLKSLVDHNSPPFDVIVTDSKWVANLSKPLSGPLQIQSVYRETYIVVNNIDNGIIDPQPRLVPVNINCQVNVAENIDHNDQSETGQRMLDGGDHFGKLMDMYRRAIDHFKISQLTGYHDIMLFGEVTMPPPTGQSANGITNDVTGRRRRHSEQHTTTTTVTTTTDDVHTGNGNYSTLRGNVPAAAVAPKTPRNFLGLLRTSKQASHRKSSLPVSAVHSQAPNGRPVLLHSVSSEPVSGATNSLKRRESAGRSAQQNAVRPVSVAAISSDTRDTKRHSLLQSVSGPSNQLQSGSTSHGLSTSPSVQQNDSHTNSANNDKPERDTAQQQTTEQCFYFGFDTAVRNTSRDHRQPTSIKDSAAIASLSSSSSTPMTSDQRTPTGIQDPPSDVRNDVTHVTEVSEASKENTGPPNQSSRCSDDAMSRDFRETRSGDSAVLVAGGATCRTPTKHSDVVVETEIFRLSSPTQAGGKKKRRSRADHADTPSVTSSHESDVISAEVNANHPNVIIANEETNAVTSLSPPTTPDRRMSSYAQSPTRDVSSDAIRDGSVMSTPPSPERPASNGVYRPSRDLINDVIQATSFRPATPVDRRSAGGVRSPTRDASGDVIRARSLVPTTPPGAQRPPRDHNDPDAVRIFWPEHQIDRRSVAVNDVQGPVRDESNDVIHHGDVFYATPPATPTANDAVQRAPRDQTRGGVVREASFRPATPIERRTRQAVGPRTPTRDVSNDVITAASTSDTVPVYQSRHDVGANGGVEANRYQKKMLKKSSRHVSYSDTDTVYQLPVDTPLRGVRRAPSIDGWYDRPQPVYVSMPTFAMSTDSVLESLPPQHVVRGVNSRSRHQPPLMVARSLSSGTAVDQLPSRDPRDVQYARSMMLDPNFGYQSHPVLAGDRLIPESFEYAARPRHVPRRTQYRRHATGYRSDSETEGGRRTISGPFYVDGAGDVYRTRLADVDYGQPPVGRRSRYRDINSNGDVIVLGNRMR